MSLHENSTYNNIERKLVRLVEELTPAFTHVEATTDLLSSSILDSLLVVDVVMYVETEFHVTLKPNDICPENLRTIESLARLVAVKQEKLRLVA